MKKGREAVARYGGLALLAAVSVLAPALLDWRDVAEPLRSASNSRGEDVVLWAFLGLAGLTGAAISATERWAPAALERIARLTGQTSVRVAVGACALVWGVGGLVALYVSDPDWVAAGIDWHDAYLAAYGLAWKEPTFYAASRYPLYPAAGAWVHSITGLPIDVALQVVTRAVMITLPIPLWIVGRRLFGRGAAFVGSAGLLLVPTFHHHLDAATCYPLYISATAWCVAGLALAVEGRLVGFGLYGVALGVALATEVKALFLGLATLPVAALFVLVVPVSSGSRALRWVVVRGTLVRLARTALMLAPLVGSYRWMESLSVIPQSLESLAVKTLRPDGDRGDRGMTGGYVWGGWSGWDQVPRTVTTLLDGAATRSTTEAERARRVGNTLALVRADYPGSTPRLLWLAGAALLLAPLATRRSDGWRPRLERAGIALALVAVASTVLPALAMDYQDRYVAHAVIFTPLLVAGAGDLLLRGLFVGSDGARAVTRVSVLAAGMAIAIGWSGFPLSSERVRLRAGAVGRGGLAEQGVREWAATTLKPGDALLDTSWLMDSLLVAGAHTVLREEPAYPPPGAPCQGDGFRVTRPGLPITGTIYALVPQEDYTPPGRLRWGSKAIAADSSWVPVSRIQSAMATVYRYTGPGVPPGWNLRVR